MLTEWGLRFALWLAPRLPQLLAYRLCALAGELYFWLNPKHSQTAVENYAVLLADDPGSPRARLLARQSFRNYVKSLYDFFRQAALDPDEMIADARADGFAHLDDALQRGRGVILVSVHFGNWDLAAAIVASRGYPIVALVDRFSPPALDRLVRHSRNRTGVGVVTLDSGSLRQAVQYLRRNTIVTVVLDRPQRVGGVPVTFFGERAWLPPGVARFALRTQAPLLFGALGRRPGDRTFYGIFDPPIEYTPTGDEAHDIQALTQIMVEKMEGLLRQHPDQWYMFRRMWPDR